MDRKEFFKKALQMGLASGSMFLFNGSNTFTKPIDEKSNQEPKDPKQKFKEDWITSLMKNLDEQFDEKMRIKLMESCGRDCARRGAIQLAESCKGSVDKMVKELAEILGKENCYRESDSVYLRYSKCLCELVDEGPDKLSDTYCICSQGWILEMFEAAAQKPVKVEVLQTIKRGNSSCKFIIRL